MIYAKQLIKIYAALALALCLSVLLSLFSQHNTYAKNAELTQQILPLNCIFQIVNDGASTIIYLTPEECGQIPEPEPEEPSPNTPTNPNRPPSGAIPLPTNITIVNTGQQVLQIPYIGNAQTAQQERLNSILNGSSRLPYMPLATVQSTSEIEAVDDGSESIFTTVPLPVAAVGAVTIFLLIILVIL